MKHYGLLAILVFFSSSIQAATCIPKVTDKKVTVEYFDGKGNVVRSETHKVRSKKKYKGLVSNPKAFKKLKKDKTGNIKIRSSKLDVESGGMTTRVSKKDGTVLASIGGCPVTKLKFFEKIGSKKSPFIHKSLVEEAAKAAVQSTSTATTAAANSSPATAEIQKSERVKRRTANQAEVQATAAAKSNPAAAEVQKSERAKRRSASEEAANLEQTLQASIAPATKTKKKRNSNLDLESSPGKPWKGVSGPLNDVYGWVIRTDMGFLGSGERSSKQYYQTISLSPYTSFSLSGQKSWCMVMHYDQPLPLESRELVENKKLTAEKKKIDALGDQFVKFNNVRLVDVGFVKGQNCVFSSVTKAEHPPKTSAFFTLKQNAGEYLKSNVVTDSGLFYPPRGESIYYNFDKPETSRLRFDKTHLRCNGWAWSSSKNFKAMKKRVQSGEFDNINAAEIEIQGMALSSYKRGVCEVDGVKVNKLN